MRRYIVNLFIVFSVSLLFPLLALAERIGIYGCLHGDSQMAVRIAQTMKAEKVTYLIGNGDFGRDIGHILKIIAEITGVGKENTYLMPGNWDYETINPHYAKMILEQYGHLIAEKYDVSGLIEIAGKKIKVAHFPQQPVPKRFLPPDKYLFRYIPHQGHTIATMARREGIPRDVYLNIYGHTHIRADFYDQETGILTINAGGLTPRKVESEQRSFAILDTDKGQVEFYSMEQEPPKLLRVVPVHQAPHDSKVNAVEAKATEPLSEYGKTFDLKDYGTCELNRDLQGKFMEDYLKFTTIQLNLEPKSH